MSTSPIQQGPIQHGPIKQGQNRRRPAACLARLAVLALLPPALAASAPPALAAVVNVSLSLNLSISASLDRAQVTERNQVVTGNFLARRVDQITANDPDLVDRLTGQPAAGAGNSIGGVGFVAEGTPGNDQVGLFASLRQIMSAAEEARARRRAELGPVMGLSAGGGAPQIDPNGWDLWVRGTWAKSDGGGRDTELGLFHAGLDYRFNDKLTVGILASFDRSAEDDDGQNATIDGEGWLVGPYAVGRLGDHAILEGRLGWGRSDNDVDATGTGSSEFTTERFLAKARLTGQIPLGHLTFAPHVGIMYFSDDQEEYTDNLGNLIAGQTVELGRLTFGPAVSSRSALEDGTSLAVRAGLEGIWDFESPEQIDLRTLEAIAGGSDLRARAEAGVSATLPSGLQAGAEAFYDGIGASEQRAYGGSVRLTVPLD